MKRIAAHGDGGKAYTAEGRAWSTTRGKWKMECVLGISSSPLGSETHGEVVGNEAKKGKPPTTEMQMRLSSHITDWQGEKTER